MATYINICAHQLPKKAYYNEHVGIQMPDFVVYLVKLGIVRAQQLITGNLIVIYTKGYFSVLSTVDVEKCCQKATTLYRPSSSDVFPRPFRNTAFHHYVGLNY